jgi:hypothetical protein
MRTVTPAGAPNIRCVTFENYTLDELVEHLDANRTSGALRTILDRYRVKRTFPDMSNFRMGPNMFGQTALDWIVFHTSAGNQGASELIAHGVTTRLRWNGDPAVLPRGWTGAVRQSYEESILGRTPPDTLVGLFISAESAFREQGWAGQVAEAMKRIGSEAGLRDLIIPLRLPTRYEWQNARMPYEEFALRKRDDGEYRDHWLRLHVRLGAEVLATSSVSHQHAMHPADLLRQVKCEPLERTGEYLVKWNDEYYSAFVDLEREYAVINEGCVWVRHPLSARPNSL